MKRTILLILILLLLSTITCAETKPSQSPKSRLHNAELPNLKGKKAHPVEGKGRKASVLLFITPDCPISNAYAPEFNAIVREFAPKKIAFSLIYVATELSGKQLEKHAKDFGYVCPTFVDRKNSLVQRVYARITPEVVVILPTGTTAYQGKIDNLYVDFGKKRHEPTERYLRDALVAILEGKRVTVTRTAPIGCFIPAP